LEEVPCIRTCEIASTNNWDHRLGPFAPRVCLPATAKASSLLPAMVTFIPLGSCPCASERFMNRASWRYIEITNCCARSAAPTSEATVARANTPISAAARALGRSRPAATRWERIPVASGHGSARTCQVNRLPGSSDSPRSRHRGLAHCAGQAGSPRQSRQADGDPRHVRCLRSDSEATGRHGVIPC